MQRKDDWLKMIGETVLITVAAFAAVIILIVLLLSFTAPVAMARLTYSMGMYGQSAWYSSLQYSYSGEVAYLFDAMNTSVTAGKDKNVIRYGEKLVVAEGFEDYCNQIDESRENLIERQYQYVYGCICIAYYNIGQGEEGLSLALSVNADTFERYNAVTDLVYQAEYIERDKDFLKTVLERLQSPEYTAGIEDDECLQEMILQLSEFMSQE